MMIAARPVRWLNATQFLGALNDNLFKLVVVFYLIEVGGRETGATIALATALFVIPFVLFSHAAGRLADRVPKVKIIRVAKVVELCLMGCGVVVLHLGAVSLLWPLLFLMCSQSAFFGPAKYGIIPELVPARGIMRTNGMLVGLTYMAIVLGSAVPSLVLLNGGGAGRYSALALLAFGFSAMGAVAAFRIRPPAPLAERGAARERGGLRVVMGTLRRDRHLSLAVIGSATFTFIAALVQQNMLVYGADYLGMRVELGGLLFTLTAVGIGIGAWLAGRSSRRTIEFGLLPLGAFGLMMTTLLLGIVPAHGPWPHLLLVVLGVSCGAWAVPLHSFVQERSPADHRGEILGLTGLTGFCGVALASGLFALLQGPLGLGAAPCFTLIGVAAAVLTIGAVLTVPDFLTRLAFAMLTRTLYRMDVRGLERVPVEGGGLLVSNHVTWADALIISAALDRPVRFVMSRQIYAQSRMKPLFDLMRVILISTQDGPKQVARALREARRGVEQGELVCIFAEGALTRTGNMLPFNAGLERIAKGTQCPIIPVHLGGLWGSIMSHAYGRLMSRWPRQLPYPVTVQFGEPMPCEATTAEVRQAVSLLAGRYVDQQKGARRSLAHSFVKQAQRRWFATAMVDSNKTRLSFGSVLTRATLLEGLLRRETAAEEQHVGILLPAGIGGALANLALTLGGRTSVNLNFTASGEALNSACRSCELRTVVTSRRFLEKVPIALPGVRFLYLEELLTDLSVFRKLGALLVARCAPVAWMARRCSADSIATVIFSSGSTGIPKGVCLSHHNVLSNCEAVAMMASCTNRDGMVGILPFFHSFGYMATLWMPLIAGYRVGYHHDPRDAAAVASLVETNGLTLMVVTPTFLGGYLRRVDPVQFQSLRMVVTGAEKLPPRLGRSFEERFGLMPLEGYGATELSPVAALSVSDATTEIGCQAGNRSGSVGQPLPGVTARVVDPTTREPLPADAEGALEIAGPSVMQGYINDAKRTASVLQGGWYQTGDLATIDGDGFITLVGRQSRYSKIGGEMVPHEAVEQVLLDATASTESCCVAVTGVADARKGERLVVLYTDAAGGVDALVALVRESALPNLWKPKSTAFVQVEAIPQLGSGKLDLAGMRQLAEES